MSKRSIGGLEQSRKTYADFVEKHLRVTVTLKIARFRSRRRSGIRTFSVWIGGVKAVGKQLPEKLILRLMEGFCRNQIEAIDKPMIFVRAKYVSVPMLRTRASD